MNVAWVFAYDACIEWESDGRKRNECADETSSFDEARKAERLGLLDRPAAALEW